MSVWQCDSNDSATPSDMVHLIEDLFQHDVLLVSAKPLVGVSSMASAAVCSSVRLQPTIREPGGQCSISTIM